MVGGDGFVLAIRAAHVVGTGKHHALDALLARRFLQVAGTQDSGLQDRAKRAFDRDAAQVNDGVDASHPRVNCRCIRQVGQVGQVGQVDFLAWSGLTKKLDIRHPTAAERNNWP